MTFHKQVPTSGMSGVFAHAVGPVETTHSEACDGVKHVGCLREVTLQNICVPWERDETGKLHAWVARVFFDRKAKRTCAGAEWEGFDLDTPLITYAAGARAGRGAETPVILGRFTKVNIRSNFGELLLVQKRHPLVAGIILAGWRLESHDPATAGFTLEELAEAVTEWGTQN